ncbi:MAG: aspartate-semialdehyde dehydrogenase [bacterium]
MIKVGVVGATGLVGKVMIHLLEKLERNIEIQAFASRSDQREIAGCPVKKLNSIPDNLDFALFSAGSSVSKQWCPEFARNDIICIDNSSAFRQHQEIPLVVPEINFKDISNEHRIISNPNCSTIPVVRVLNCFIESIGGFNAVTFQSVSGAGRSGIQALIGERTGQKADKSPFETGIFNNVIPKIGDVLKDGATAEEKKMVEEARKILHREDLKITSTCVRVPVEIGHSIAVTVDSRNITPAQIRKKLEEAEDIVLCDIPNPLDIAGTDNISVGRIRSEWGNPRKISLFICADNLRVGAATNAVRILKKMLD